MTALRLALGLMLGLTLVAVAAADDKPDKKAARKGVAGLVEKYDPASGTLTIRTGRKNDPNAGTITVTLSSDTKISIREQDGIKPGKPEDVASAKRVMVRKETKNGKEVAVEVIVIAGKKGQ